MRSHSGAFHLPVMLMASSPNRELTSMAATNAGVMAPPAAMTEA